MIEELDDKKHSYTNHKRRLINNEYLDLVI
jgi:hypothetical protein